MTEIFLTLPEVCSSIRLGKSWIYDAIARRDGSFPNPIRLTPRNTVWRQSEIEDWKLARIKESVAERESGLNDRNANRIDPFAGARETR